MQSVISIQASTNSIPPVRNDVSVVVQMVRDEYLSRRKLNPSYSLRAFSRDLQISPSVLSEIFSGKRPPTREIIERVAGGLDLTSPARARLLRFIQRSPVKSRSKLRKDQFRLISEWYYFAILSLVKTVGFESNPKWIANRLGITSIEAKTALDRLLDMGLIYSNKNTLVRSKKRYDTVSDVSDAALRRSHRQSIKQALECIEKVPLNLRDVTSLTVAFDPAMMAQVKTEIYNFMVKTDKLISKGQCRSEVYNMNIQFVPVTKPLT